MKSCLDGAPDERGRCPAAEPVALMRSLVVVIAHKLGERPLQRWATGKVSASEGDAPVLLQDRALQALNEAVGPGMTRLRAGVAQAELPTGLIEGSVELGAPVGQDIKMTLRYAHLAPDHLRSEMSRTERSQPAAEITQDITHEPVAEVGSLQK